MGQVLRWFENNNVEFISSVPSIGDVEFKDDGPLFAPHRAGSHLDRRSSELEMLISGGRDGGLYIHDRVEVEMSDCSPMSRRERTSASRSH